MEHNFWGHNDEARSVSGGRLLVVEQRVQRIERELEHVSSKVNDIEGLVRETRDIVFELKGRSKNGNAAIETLKTIALALLAALLAVFGVKEVVGGGF